MQLSERMQAVLLFVAQHNRPPNDAERRQHFHWPYAGLNRTSLALKRRGLVSCGPGGGYDLRPTDAGRELAASIRGPHDEPTPR